MADPNKKRKVSHETEETRLMIEKAARVVGLHLATYEYAPSRYRFFHTKQRYGGIGAVFTAIGSRKAFEFLDKYKKEQDKNKAR